MSLQEEFVTETDIAKIQQSFMDTESIPTSIDDIQSKNFKRQFKVNRRKANSLEKKWDVRTIKRISHTGDSPQSKKNRKVTTRFFASSVPVSAQTLKNESK